MKAKINQESLTDFVCCLVTRFQRSVHHYPSLGRLAGWSFATAITTTMNTGALIGIIENLALVIFNLITSLFKQSKTKDLQINLVNLKDFGLHILTSSVFFITTTQTFWNQWEREKKLEKEYKWKSIHFAAAYDDTKQLEEIITQDQSLLDLQDQKLATPLHIAVKKRNIASVKLLIQKKAKLDVIDIDNKTPLFIAQEANQTKMIQLLSEQFSS